MILDVHRVTVHVKHARDQIVRSVLRAIWIIIGTTVTVSAIVQHITMRIRNSMSVSNVHRVVRNVIKPRVSRVWMIGKWIVKDDVCHLVPINVVQVIIFVI